MSKPNKEINMILKCLIQREIEKKIQWKVADFGGSGGSAAVSHSSTLFIPMNIIIPKKAFLKTFAYRFCQAI